MTDRETKGRNRDVRRRAIMAAAERVFFADGYDKATMDRVAAEVGLSKGCLYLYFKNKDDLYFAIAHEGLSMIREHIDAAGAGALSGLDHFTAMFRAYLEFTRAEPDHADAVLFFENAMNDLHEEVPNFVACRELCRQTLGVIRDVVHKGVADGSIRKDIDVNQVVVMFWTQASGVLTLARQPSAMMMSHFGVTFEDSADSLVELMRCAVAPLQTAGA